MKSRTAILILLLGLLTSCPNNGTTIYSTASTVTSFVVLSDKSDAIRRYTFTISDVDLLIQNVDSMPYGTRVDSLAPMILPQFVEAYIDDTISLYARDTVWVDFTHDRMLTVTAADGVTKTTYRVRVNCHQVDPDSFVWHKLADSIPDGVYNKAVYAGDRLVWLSRGAEGLKIAHSIDGESWTTAETAGLPADTRAMDIEHTVVWNDEVALMNGSDLYVSQAGLGWQKIATTTEVELLHLLFAFRGDLYALGRDNKLLKLAGTQWVETAQLDERFPVRGEAVCTGKAPSGTERVYVFGGIDAQGNYLDRVYSTENGNYWVNLTHKSGLCTPRAYAAMAQYGNGLLVVGGTTADSLCHDNLIYSRDYGMTWIQVDTAYKIDTLIAPVISARSHASLLAPADGRLFLVGGRNAVGYIGDLWRGVQYSLLPGFKK